MNDEKKPAELTQKELDQVSGGSGAGEKKIGYTKTQIVDQICKSNIDLEKGIVCGKHFPDMIYVEGKEALQCRFCGTIWVSGPRGKFYET